MTDQRLSEVDRNPSTYFNVISSTSRPSYQPMEEFECDRLLENQYASLQLSRPSVPSPVVQPNVNVMKASFLRRSALIESDRLRRRTIAGPYGEETLLHRRCISLTTATSANTNHPRVLTPLNSLQTSFNWPQENDILNNNSINYVQQHQDWWLDDTHLVNDELMSYLQNPSQGRTNDASPAEPLIAKDSRCVEEDDVVPSFSPPPGRPGAPEPYARGLLETQEALEPTTGDTRPTPASTRRSSHFKPVSPVMEEVMYFDMVSSFSAVEPSLKPSATKSISPIRIRPIADRSAMKFSPNVRCGPEGAETVCTFEESPVPNLLNCKPSLVKSESGLRLISGNTFLPRGERSAFDTCSKGISQQERQFPATVTLV